MPILAKTYFYTHGKYWGKVNFILELINKAIQSRNSEANPLLLFRGLQGLLEQVAPESSKLKKPKQKLSVRQFPLLYNTLTIFPNDRNIKFNTIRQ